ncbi:MAG: tetratricopeptide repeat protein, partial [Ignavibacterium sp.]
NALDAYDQCLRINPKDSNSLYSKAKINFILHRTQEAIDCLKKAFEINPDIRSEFENEYPDIKSSKLFKKLLGEV